MRSCAMEEDITFTVRYVAEGVPVAENYQSALGAIGRVGALIAHGAGCNFTIWSGACVLLEQDAICESLRLGRRPN